MKPLFLLVLLLASGVFGLWWMNRLDPAKASLGQFALLYLLIFSFIFSLTSLAGYGFRLAFWRGGSRYLFLRSALKQALLFGFLSVIALLLLSADLLNPWTAIFLLAIFVLIELYVISY